MGQERLRQPRSEISTPNFLAAALMRRHALSRSASLTPSTCMNRATAFRTCLASIKGSFRSLANANDELGRSFFFDVLNVGDFLARSGRFAAVAFLVLLFAVCFLIVDKARLLCPSSDSVDVAVSRAERRLHHLLVYLKVQQNITAW
jgi:hypothetical protein